MLTFVYLLVGFLVALYQTAMSYKEGLRDKNSLVPMFFLTLFFWPFLFLYFKANSIFKSKK